MKNIRTFILFAAAASALELHAQQPSPAADQAWAATELTRNKIRAGKAPTQQEMDDLAAARVPAGSNVTEADLARLADGAFNRQVLYLVGTFTVTARTGDRAVMRFEGKPKGPRITAVYPPAVPTPAEGAKLVRDGTESRTYLITEVRQSPSGQIEIWVCDITRS